MSVHINLFEPYTHKESNHEDSLTRAFLIVLRIVPLAHAAWLSLVDAGHRQNGGAGLPPYHQLPTASIDTQIGSLQHDVERVVSMVQCEDPYTTERGVGYSDRMQVLDGVIAYPPKLAIVFENKPSRSQVVPEQLDINLGLNEEERPDLDPRPAFVTWHELIAAWANLLVAGGLGHAERVVLQSFLEFVERHFDHLRPFSTVEQCKGSRRRLEWRCQCLLQDEFGVTDERSGWGPYVPLAQGRAATMMGFLLRELNSNFDFQLVVALGDTTSQSRVLYSFDFAVVEALARAGWSMQTNLHASQITTNLWYPEASESIDDARRYWNVWQSNSNLLRSWRHEEWQDLLAALQRHRVSSATDHPRFHSAFTHTVRSRLNLCPGFILRYTWSFEDAARLDAAGQFQHEVRKRAEEIAAAFQLGLPGPTGEAQ